MIRSCLAGKRRSAGLFHHPSGGPSPATRGTRFAFLPRRDGEGASGAAEVAVSRGRDLFRTIEEHTVNDGPSGARGAEPPPGGERCSAPPSLSPRLGVGFSALMTLFFAVAVPLTTGGAVNFLTIRNSQNILVAIVPVLLLGLGQTFVIIAAGIDLSVGWVMSLASVLSALASAGPSTRGAPVSRRCLGLLRRSPAPPS